MAKKRSKKKKDNVKAKDSKKLDSKEEVCEVFEVKKKGKETEKTTCGSLEKKHATKEDLKKQDKILRNILIAVGIIVLIIIGIIFISNSAKGFEYRTISGKVVKEGNIIFYEVVFPVKYQGEVVPWYVYIRNDPRKLDKEIPFEGEMDFGRRFDDGMYRLVLNISDTFNCEYGAISIGNMLNLQALGVKVVRDENATCDSEGRYMYANLKKGEESKVVQVGDSCYDLIIKDCEILQVTERFMVEMFVEYYSE